MAERQGQSYGLDGHRIHSVARGYGHKEVQFPVVTDVVVPAVTTYGPPVHNE